jgi:hypothetical protein
MDVMDEIAIADNAGPWLDESLADRRKIMGFGHRVYKNGDSRVPDMRAALEQIAALRGGQRLLDIYETLAKAMHDAKGLHPKPRLPRRARLPPDRLRYPTFTPDLRRRPAPRMDRPYHRAARREQPHPPPCRLRRASRTPPDLTQRSAAQHPREAPTAQRGLVPFVALQPVEAVVPGVGTLNMPALSGLDRGLIAFMGDVAGHAARGG